MLTVERHKLGRVHYARTVNAQGVVTEWYVDKPIAWPEIDEALAAKIVTHYDGKLNAGEVLIRDGNKVVAQAKGTEAEVRIEAGPIVDAELAKVKEQIHHMEREHNLLVTKSENVIRLLKSDLSEAGRENEELRGKVTSLEAENDKLKADLAAAEELVKGENNEG